MLTFIDQIEKVYKSDREIKNAKSPLKLGPKVYSGFASTLNKYADLMPRLVLQGGFNILFATSSDEFRIVEASVSVTPSSNTASAIRDSLGLVHVGLDAVGRPTPLFVFHSQKPLSAWDGQLRVRRPTTVEGFDNRRFKQAWPLGELVESGAGRTVDIDPGGYGPGCSEFVMSGLTLKDNFTCHYIGLVDTNPAGSDHDFLDYLLAGRSETFDDMWVDLQARLRGRA
jgi:hypothetical protein